MGFGVSCNGLCKCTMGATPSVLTVLPTVKVLNASLPIATVSDHAPFVNILPFGVCKSIACPTTAALTAAALGVLTPGPCIPNTSSPWAPGSPTVTIGGQAALNNSSKLSCSYGGQISISFPGSTTLVIP